MAKLCAAWWQTGAPGKEGLITQMIPYLLVRALSTCELSHKQPKSSVAGQRDCDRLDASIHGSFCLGINRVL